MIARLLQSLRSSAAYWRPPLILLSLATLVLLPQFVTRTYVMGILCRILLYITLAGSLNAINGYSGQTCIGHAGFFCIGAYFEAILATKYGAAFWLLVPAAGAFTALAGLIIALPTLKMTGIYLAIVTLGFSEITRLTALNWESLTGGPLGIKGIPVPHLFSVSFRSSRNYYYLFLVTALLFLFVTGRVVRSRVGRAWMSIREDQAAARALGVEASRYKALNFMYGAFWAGVAGAVYAPYVRFIDSTFFTLDEGFNILSMVIIGGQGTLAGPVLGSVIVNLLTELLRPVGQWRMVAYGILIVVMMWWRPQGLAGASDSILAGRDIRRRSGERAGQP